MFASTLTIGSTSAGNSTFLIRLPPEISTLADSVSEDGKPGPRQDAAEKKQRVGPDVGRVQSGHDHGEHKRVHSQQQQRIDERPEKPQDRSAIARLEIAGDERLNQAAVADKRAEVLQHLGSGDQGQGPGAWALRPGALVLPPRRDSACSCCSVLRSDRRARSKSISTGTCCNISSARAMPASRPFLVQVFSAFGHLRQHRDAIG